MFCLQWSEKAEQDKQVLKHCPTAKNTILWLLLFYTEHEKKGFCDFFFVICIQWGSHKFVNLEKKWRLDNFLAAIAGFQLILGNYWHSTHFSTTMYSRRSIGTGTKVGELMKMCSLGWAGCSNSAHELVDKSSITRGRKSLLVIIRKCSKFFLHLLFVV